MHTAGAVQQSPSLGKNRFDMYVRVDLERIHVHE